MSELVIDEFILVKFYISWAILCDLWMKKWKVLLPASLTMK